MPDEPNKIQSIEHVEEPLETESSTPAQRRDGNKEQFDNAMNGQAGAAAGERVSLMDTARAIHTGEGRTGGPANIESLVAQTQEAVTRIEEIKHTLESPNISIKSSAQSLLQGKLGHIDESLRIALSRAGIEHNPTADGVATTPARVNPIERFLGFLTDGQWQLQHLGSELRVMGMNNKELSPVSMLAIQVKVGQIQQELELFSGLLNKALESIKTVMNIQV